MTVKTWHDKTYKIQPELSSDGTSVALKTIIFIERMKVNGLRINSSEKVVRKEQRKQEEKYNLK